jgi:hypothetical protein
VVAGIPLWDNFNMLCFTKHSKEIKGSGCSPKKPFYYGCPPYSGPKSSLIGVGFNSKGTKKVPNKIG